MQENFAMEIVALEYICGNKKKLLKSNEANIDFSRYKNYDSLSKSYFNIRRSDLICP